MVFGYARVSSRDQHLDMQLDTLTKAGCERIFEEKISGAVIDRPALNNLCQMLRPGDVVIVTHLDRLGRDSDHLISLVSGWGQQGIHFRSLDLGIDTNSIAGELVLRIFSALAQYNRKLIKDKQQSGQELARAKGKHMGRPPGIDVEKLNRVRTATKVGLSISEIVKVTMISKSTVKRYMRIILKDNTEQTGASLIN